jgi:hypothetical protein
VVPILVLLLRRRRDNTKNLTQMKYKGHRVDFFTVYSNDDFWLLCCIIFLKAELL